MVLFHALYPGPALGMFADYRGAPFWTQKNAYKINSLFYTFQCHGLRSVFWKASEVLKCA